MKRGKGDYCWSRLDIGAATVAILVAVVGVTPGSLAAGVSYGAGGSGAFSVSCSGPADGGLPNPGFDNRLWFQAGSVCNTNVSTAGATSGTNTSSSFSSGGVSTSGQAQTGNKIIKVLATMSSDEQDSVRFPAGFADAGWTDTLTVNSPGNEGQLAVVNIILNITGTLTASGPNSFSRLWAFVGTDIGTPSQPFYQVQAGVNPSPTIINDTLILPLDFLIGTAGEFIVKIQAQAMTSSATSFGNNNAMADFWSTITWGGIDSVTFGNGDPLPNFSLLSASNVDWTEAAVVPLPASIGLFGIGALFLRRFKRST